MSFSGDNPRRPQPPRRSPAGARPGGGRPLPPSIPPRGRTADRPTRQPATRAPQPVRSRRAARPPRRTYWRRRLLIVLAAIAVILLLLTLWAWRWVDSRINHVDALSGAADTPGRTYLIVGSDSREGWDEDGVDGARTDTIIVLHQPQEGPTALISIPRDSYVEIPGRGQNKINASYAFGGPELLVLTVEQHTGLTIDHYLEVGFAGVADIVDAVGGVELCYDRDVDDRRSTMTWTAGCHEVDGRAALAFSRMRYADPLGDIGRTQRQQQLITRLAEKLGSGAALGSPGRAMAVADAGLAAVRVSTGTSPWDLVQAALAFRSAQGDDAVTGTPPIVSLNHRVEGVGSTVLLDPDRVDSFWRDIASGAFEPGSEVGGYGS